MSIVVPAFNEERYLPRSLGSLDAATLMLRDCHPHVGIETIVVDNGSRDGTAAVAERHGAVVVPEPRRGISTARNAGARAASGDALVFMDADYRVPPWFLVELLRGLQDATRPAALGVRVALEPGEIDPVTRSVGAFGLMLIRRLRRMSFGVLAIRTETFLSLGGYDERLFGFEDVDILERLAAIRPRDGRYQILHSLVVFASARGFTRGGMLPTYLRLAAMPAWRSDIDRCAYWYERR